MQDENPRPENLRHGFTAATMSAKAGTCGRVTRRYERDGRAGDGRPQAEDIHESPDDNEDAKRKIKAMSLSLEKKDFFSMAHDF